MKNILFNIFFLCLIFSSMAKGSPLSLSVVSDDKFPPFSYKENGKVTGIDIDIINEMGKRLNIKFNISLVPWKRLIMMTQLGDCDGSMSLFRTPEREKFSLYTYPVHYSSFVIFVMKGKEFKFTKIEDLYGKKLAKQSGFAISDEFDLAVKRGKIKVADIFHIKTCMGETLIGKYDGFVANKHVTLYKLKNDKKFVRYKEKFTILKNPVKLERGAFFVISKASKIKDKLKLQKNIIKTLKSMEENGTYQKIMDKYLK